MKITSRDTYTTHEFAVEGAPEIPPTKYRRVTLIPRKVRWRSRDGLVRAVWIEGPSRRRDGTVGTRQHGESVAHPSTADAVLDMPAPDWVLKLVADAGLRWGAGR